MNSRMKKWSALAVAGIIAAGPAAHAAVKAQKMFALGHVNFRSADGRTPKNTINFYDVTDIGPGGVSSGVFNNQPLFSVFIGMDYVQGFNAIGAPFGSEEDAGAFTFNPVNGTMYTLSFNQNTDPLGGTNPTYGDSRASNDTTGDFDLWRINYQAILNDYVTNNRPRGVIYAPEFAPTSIAFEQQMAASSHPKFDGTVDGKLYGLDHEESYHWDANDVNDPMTIRVPNSILKIGEVGRAPTDRTGGASFFDQQIEFINPATLLRLDGSNNDTPAGDFQIRVYNRVSTSPGLATMDLDGPDNILGTVATDPNGNDDFQGGWNRGTVESWESKIIGRLQMDADGRSDSPEWAFVKKGSTMGVWVKDGDGTDFGDDLSFFQIDFSTPTPTVTKKDLFQSGSPATQPNFINVAENPNVDPSTSNGEVDNILIDKNGNLIVVESGFNDVITGSTTPPRGAGGLTAQEPKVFTALIGNYNGPDTDGDGIGEVLPAGPAGTGFNDTAAWSTAVSPPITGAIDDDDDVTDSRFVALDRGTGYIYIVDQEASFTNYDIYVFDPATGTIVYSEKDATTPGIMNKQTLGVLTRGDANDDGTVDGADIDLVYKAIADPTLGGTVPALLGKEWYDLTNDGDLTPADATEMITKILKTRNGDQNLDGKVDKDDLAIIRAGFGAGTGWATGDANGDGRVDGSDFMVWQRNVGFNNGALAAVPEPASAAMIGVALGALARAARKRRS